jgi:putative endonuclease
LAARWLAESQVHPREVRFDVVAVLPQPRGASQVEHVRAAF